MGRAVVVTGASTGIGLAASQRLAADGFDVFASVRKDSDAERLRALGLWPLMLDVTDPESIAAAVAEVEAAVGTGGLAGLVNNAGVAITAPLEFIPLDRLREQMDINFIGQIAVTQAFLPALRAARGRIVFISSIGGKIAMPLVGAYAASKFALEGAADSLRRELRGQGIEVSVVEPGGVKTPIWAKGTETGNEIEAQLPAQAGELYGHLTAALRKASADIATNSGIEPEEVADRVAHALTARKPKTRYLVGRDAKARAAVAKRIPDRWFDALIARALR
jgi:NAD(P)-dependent dehydrogenase (short-subunit alcohol dehydrogenase family)